MKAKSNDYYYRKRGREKKKMILVKEETFIGAFLELLVVGGLLDEVEDGDGQLGVSQGIRLRVHRLRALTQADRSDSATKQTEMQQHKRLEKEFRLPWLLPPPVDRSNRRTKASGSAVPSNPFALLFALIAPAALNLKLKRTSIGLNLDSIWP